MSKSQSAKAVEIKISTIVAVSVIVHNADPEALDAAMAGVTGGLSDYFEGEFAVIDVGPLPREASVDWPALVAVLKRHNLNPVAVRNAGEEQVPHILAQGLSLDTLATPREAPRAEPAPAPAPAPAPQPQPVAASAGEAMIVDSPVRAGQRIYARGCDLVLMAAVNNGAEVIADGSIHVYAPLRGRALAGASGNAQARIFAASMEPELVSIAGIYRTFEDGFPKEQARRPAQIKLSGDRLDIVPIELNPR